MSGSRSLGNALVDIFVAPGAAFEALRERSWGWPAFVLIAGTAAFSVWLFFSGMSPEWIVDQQLLSMGEVSQRELAQARAPMEAVAPHTGLIAAVFTPIVLGLTILVFGGIVALGAKMLGGERHSYGKWLRLTTWTQMPGLINSLGMIVLTLMASTPNQPLSAVNYASFNNLLLNWTPAHAGYGWAEATSLFFIWSIALATIGIRRWTGAGIAGSLAVALIPYALIFGVWGLIVAL